MSSKNTNNLMHLYIFTGIELDWTMGAVFPICIAIAGGIDYTCGQEVHMAKQIALRIPKSLHERLVAEAKA